MNAATMTTKTADSRARVSMGANLERPAYLRNLNGRPSLFLRCADKWGCQATTARSRVERSMSDALDVVEELVRMGDTERLGHYLTLFDAVLAGQPQLPKLDAVYQHDHADAHEDVAQAEYRKDPCIRTARKWFDQLGREGRSAEPVMAALRAKWGL
jgi:hypothetical protein